MPYKMIGKKRVWVEEEIEPQIATAPAAAPVPRMSYDELIGRNVIGRDALSGLFGSVGAPDWQTAPGGNDESGAPILEDTPNAQAASRLNGYTFDWNDTGVKNTGTLTAFDPKGAQAGQFHQQDQSTLSQAIEAAALAAAGFGGVGLMGLGPLGGLLGGAGAAGGAAAEGATAGAIGAGEGAAQLAAYTAANPVTAAQIAATIPAAGLPGIGAVGGGLLAGVPAESLGALEAFSAANPLTAAQVTASTLPAGGLPGLSGGFAAAAPEALFNAAADSQLASNQLGITGAQSAAAATSPAAVDLGSIGGITSTAAPMPLEALRAGELAGYSTNGALPSSPAVPTGTGGLLGQLPSALQGGAQWMKDNPMLGRLLLGGASSLLSSAGGSSGESAPVNTGPAKKWNSPIQQGLLGNVQQYAPPAIAQNRPAGLLAQGHQNAGAWRFLGG